MLLLKSQYRSHQYIGWAQLGTAKLYIEYSCPESQDYFGQYYIWNYQQVTG